MENRSLIKRTGLACAALLVGMVTTLATPTTDECVSGNGCVNLQTGAKVSFNFTANFDLETLSDNGTLVFTDSALQGGVTLNSSTLLNYTLFDATTRQFDYDLSGTAYGSARVTVVDNGATGDSIQIQLLDTSGVPVYDTLLQPLSSACPGGITIGTCVNPSPCQLEVTALCATPKAGGGHTAPTGECAINGTNGPIDFIYVIKNAGTTTVALSSLTATDSFGGLDLSSLGGGSLAPGESVTLTITETVTGPFPFVNSVTVTGGPDQCSGSASITIQQTNPPPPPPTAECDDFVTGGGWICGTPSGAKGNFGVHGGIKNGKLWGGLNYLDHGKRLHVKSTAVTAYTQTGENCRQIKYNVTINGKAGTATVDVCDNGEPGRNDTFSIKLSDGYTASGDLGGPRPGGGNIQLHKKRCKEDNDHGGNGGNGGNCNHGPKCDHTNNCEKCRKGDKCDHAKPDKCNHGDKCDHTNNCEKCRKGDKCDHAKQDKCNHGDKCDHTNNCEKCRKGDKCDHANKDGKGGKDDKGGKSKSQSKPSGDRK